MQKEEILAAATKYVEEHIGEFHKSRLDKLMGIKLNNIISKKNPYLFKAKNIDTAGEFVNNLLSATISSSEETIFGNWLEGLAIHIAKLAHGGGKSAADGMDLEITIKGIRYLVVIKSGMNWGNKSQVQQMKENFVAAARRLKTSGNRETIEFVNGICYGRTTRNIKRPTGGPDYHFLCGQEFWEFISGDDTLYIDIIQPLGHQAQERNEEYSKEYAALKNRLDKEFLESFCDEEGYINWEKIVKLTSAKKAPTIATNATAKLPAMPKKASR